ncbi:MAG: response regulator transcription factor [Puia sp.]|nr:response regulator transcription factor [Puia sp.]
MVKCIVVDDEPLARQVLEKHILRTPELVLVKKCANALEAFDTLSREKPDLAFLDIHMPVLNGIDFIRSLKAPPAVIITTAFSEYAVQSYELEVVDYLMKPITFERFSMALSKFLKIHAKPPEPNSYSYFKVDGKLVKLEHADILYAQSIRDYIILGTSHGNRIVHMTMKNLEELLPASMFARIHRSFVIGMAHITTIAKDQVSIGEISIPVGGNYKTALDGLKARILSKG